MVGITVTNGNVNVELGEKGVENGEMVRVGEIGLTVEYRVLVIKKCLVADSASFKLLGWQANNVKIRKHPNKVHWGRNLGILSKILVIYGYF